MNRRITDPLPLRLPILVAALAVTVYVVPADEAGYHWNLRETVISPALAGTAPFNAAPQIETSQGSRLSIRDAGMVADSSAVAAPFNGAPGSMHGSVEAAASVSRGPNVRQQEAATPVSPPIMGRTRDGRDFVMDFPSQDIPELAIIHQVDCVWCFPKW